MSSTDTVHTPGNGVAVTQPRGIALKEWDDEFARLVKATVLKPKDREATNAELALFAEQVQRTGLSPFLGQIYGIYRYDSRVRGQAMQVQVGIDGFRLIAERTGKYEGQTTTEWCGPDGAWKDVWLNSEHPAAARVGVYKTGRREPTYAVAHWVEYVQTGRDGAPTGQWPTMPANQLGKCAEALALRKCFPAELSGLHTPEEMAHADSTPEEIVDAMPVEEVAPTASQIDEAAALARALVEAGVWTDDDLSKHLVAAGALDTTTIEGALATMPSPEVAVLVGEMTSLQVQS